MLTSLRVQNFKGWRDTGEIRLAPLTVVFGENSAGKSSLGHLLLALKQTVFSTDRKKALHLGDENAFIDLGSFQECIYNHDMNNKLQFSFAWELANKLKITNAIDKNSPAIDGHVCFIEVKFGSDKYKQAAVENIEYRLGDTFGISYGFSSSEKDKKYDLRTHSKNFDLKRTQGRVWDLDAPEKFYRISEQTKARFQNAGFVSDFALQVDTLFERFYYLGPLREYPKRIYTWSGENPESVGQKGESVMAALLAATEYKRKISFGERQRYMPFNQLIAKQLKRLGIIDSFEVRPIAEGRKDYEVFIRNHSKGTEVKITDVGFGVSQVIPALVQAFYCPANSTVWMEQPEIHLHPQVQAELADVFIDAIHARENNKPRNTQLIVESHSEHFLTRLQRRLAEGELKKEEIAVYFCTRDSSGESILEELKLDLCGNILNWPPNFFGDMMTDIFEREFASIRKSNKGDAGG